MSILKTQGGIRNDLAQIEVNLPVGYIGSEIMPTLPVNGKSGTVYYQALTADKTAQTGRSAGSAPTATVLGSSKVTYTATEIIERYLIANDEVSNYGNIEKVDRIGAMASKRSVMNAMEKSISAIVFSAANYAAGTNVNTDIFGGIQDAVQEVKRYAGQTVVVMSETAYQKMLAKTEIKSALSYQINGVANNTLEALLQSLYGVERLLVGDDLAWNIANQEDEIAVIKLPEAGEESHRLDAVYGKNVLYLPNDAETPFELNTFYSNDKLGNVYDAQVFSAPKVLNAGALNVLKIDAV